ncbi:hypothetical protein PORY_002038 [Pneumocystis oryctolagi]|uniref:Uncharacterized protein n=1 Tax=Pneumocystis oryctolagi TaxID=42067 RepID=A0ACB7CC83_9ASCO|nr:hypothetical protein PORY_002038 [Pneumocystis oryctolagi]
MEKEKYTEKEKKERIQKEKILNEIAVIAGAINRHKHKREVKNAENLSTKSYHYPRNPKHRSRHMSLIVNTGDTNANINNSSQPIPSGWIQRKDRHIQLINASIYDSTAKKRVKEIEETRLQKKLKQELLKEEKSENLEKNDKKELIINGVKFYMKKNKNKLIRAKDNDPSVKTLKKAFVSGSVFWRSRNGNLWRASLIKSKIKKNKFPVKKIEKNCQYYTRLGKCLQGKSCPYKHNPNHVAICPLFMKGKCPNENSCDLSHEPTPHRVSACLHFLRGQCSNTNCLYAHIRVNPSAPICREFAIDGYCEKGVECREKHLRECPDFSEKGSCSIKNCRLPHIERAARKRKENFLVTSDDESSVHLESHNLTSNTNIQSTEESRNEDPSFDEFDSDSFSSLDSSTIDANQDFIRL